MDAGWMEKYSLARARMQLAALAIAWRSAFETSLTRFDKASDAKLLLACSGACLLSAETQMTPFRPKINCTPAGDTSRVMPLQNQQCCRTFNIRGNVTDNLP